MFIPLGELCGILEIYSPFTPLFLLGIFLRTFPFLFLPSH